MVKKLFVLFAILTDVLSSCSDRIPEENIIVSSDLDSIIQRGRLVAVTDFNSTNYFIYKGEPMGFHYELLKSFTDHIGVDLEVITENDIQNAFDILKSGKADLMAIGLTVNSTRKKEILFTDPIIESRQVLVQLKPRNWRSMTADALERHLIRNQLHLAHKTVYIQENSAHSERLLSLSREIGDTINVIEVPFESEELIKNVAIGEIEYTVCDENVAQVNSTYYPDIDVNTPVSFPQKIAWGMRKENSIQLSGELNRWLNSYKKTSSFTYLFAKYFKNSRSSIIVNSDYYAINTGKISRWDETIKSASKVIGWDWRLLSSLVCQESRFDADVISWAGAFGLMQLMPLTGQRYGIDITSSPENNINAGTMYIKSLQAMFEQKIPDEKERIKFILASYNAGPGHVLDAMKLAEKNGMDPGIWDGNVAVWLLKKSEPEFYTDSIVKNGYFKGTESVNFVIEVLDRFEHYRNLIPETSINKITLNKE